MISSSGSTTVSASAPTSGKHSNIKSDLRIIHQKENRSYNYTISGATRNLSWGDVAKASLVESWSVATVACQRCHKIDLDNDDFRLLSQRPANRMLCIRPGFSN